MFKGLKGYLLRVTWWDHTYDVDQEADPDRLRTYGVFNKLETKQGKKYLKLYGEDSLTDKDWRRHHYTILTDDIILIEKLVKV